MRFLVRYLMLVPVVLALILSGCGTFTGNDEIAQLETRNAQLQGTIEVFGTPAATIAVLQNAATQAVLLQAQLAAAQNEALAAKATLTVLELIGGSGNVQPTPAPAAPNVDASGPPNQPEVAPTPGTLQTRFTGTVTSTDRDAQDCPIGVTSVFTPDEDVIYVITRVNVLPAGSQLSARWMANGSLYFDDVECWIPDQDWYDICAYCSISPDGPAFEVGDWSVELLLNGQLMSQAQFRVSAPDGGGAEATPVSLAQ